MPTAQRLQQELGLPEGLLTGPRPQVRQATTPSLDDLMKERGVSPLAPKPAAPAPDLFEQAVGAVPTQARGAVPANIAAPATTAPVKSKRFGVGRLALGGLGIGAALTGAGVMMAAPGLVQKQPGFGMQGPAHWQQSYQM